MVSLFLNNAIIIASPMAASAAATVIMKNTKIWPFKFPRNDENATNTRLTELSISSMHIKTIIALRRMRTPMTPMINRSSASMRKKFKFIFKNKLNNALYQLKDENVYSAPGYSNALDNNSWYLKR